MAPAAGHEGGRTAAGCQGAVTPTGLMIDSHPSLRCECGLFRPREPRRATARATPRLRAVILRGPRMAALVAHQGRVMRGHLRMTERGWHQSLLGSNRHVPVSLPAPGGARKALGLFRSAE